MTKIDVISGFLGAGKTTLIKKLLSEALNGDKVVLIENEYGEIGIDGGFLQDSGIEIREMNSGCICCSLVGDFEESLKEVIAKYAPERILIEPSGVGKLSDVQRAIHEACESAEGVTAGSSVAVVDASKCKVYMKNFGEFFIDQVEHAGTIVLSRTQNMTEEKVAEVVALLREHNKDAKIITTPWDDLKGSYILETFEAVTGFAEELLEEFEHEHEHHHHHDDDDEECCCGHHHHHDDDDDDDDDDEHEHHHHHHDDDDDDDDEHEHHHHHHDGEECGCGHHHHHHHGHDADEIFTSLGYETAATYTEAQVNAFLAALDSEEYGHVLRAKGMLPGENGKWIYFDYVPEEKNVRNGEPQYTGKICVIGSELKEDAIKDLILTRKGN